ncbi:MAG: SPFH domain-containing protein [Planctomycetota bacterium]|jgi:regulator of protease activity HflC (stomatin/prohibitin superfamily)
MKKFAVAPRLLAALAIGFLLVAGGAWLTIEWTYNYHWVPEGHSMSLRYKGPPLPLPFLGMQDPAPPGQFAKVTEGYRTPDELGVLKHMVGPGRHFYCPLWWQCDIVPDTVIKPGEVGIVASKMGNDLPEGDFLVDGDLGSTEYKGILRKVLAPGRYRINPYAYQVEVVSQQSTQSGNQVKRAGWVRIPAGYVGVVTNLASNTGTGKQAGIQQDVLTPGLYPINPREQQVDIVNIGYRELSIIANMKQDRDGKPMYEPSGEPTIEDDESGIGFPSNDGFDIRMDFTAIWGIMPEQAPDVIREFGNVEAVEQKVVDPQIESICRQMGSSLKAVDLLVGETRTKFQEDTSAKFHEKLEAKGITVLNGLVRHIYIPQAVRTPMQEANIAAELKLTREQEQLTAKTEAMLRKAEAEVTLATEKINAETERMVAAKLAEGEKTAQETTAETQKLVAAIDRKVAEIESEATRTLGQADAQVRQMEEEAKSDRFKLAVEAFGSGEAYNQWVFARGLPDDIQLDMIYAGEGTFWTDLKGFSEAMLGKQAEKQRKPVSPRQR